MQSQTRAVTALGLLVLAGVISHAAQSAVVTDPLQISASATIITFEDMALGAVRSPFAVGDVTFAAETGLAIASVAGYGADGTEVANLTLKPDPTPFYDEGPYSTTLITFAEPVSQFLVGWFDPNLPNNVAQALDAEGAVLEEGMVQNGPAGGVHAAWIGFVRPRADIHAVAIVPGAPNDWYGIDNLHYVLGAVEECPEDFNGDGMVDGSDLGLLLGNWGGPGVGDLDGSGVVDGADMGLLLAAWGPCR